MSTAAQTRIIDSALELFAEHGVSGTSLQMIADSIGVTKAAIYHQYPTKDEIVFAAIEVDLAQVRDALDAADAAPSRKQGRELVLATVIDLAVERRDMVTAVQHDPVVARFLAEHKPFRKLMQRLYAVLTDGDTSVEARANAAIVSAAIGGAATHPLVADLDDDELRTHLLAFARAQLGW